MPVIVASSATNPEWYEARKEVTLSVFAVFAIDVLILVKRIKRG